MTEKRAQIEGLNFGSPLSERNDKDFLDAKSLITWSEETKNKAEKFPRQWLKEQLVQESKEFLSAFAELLKKIVPSIAIFLTSIYHSLWKLSLNASKLHIKPQLYKY